jgi:hypothetical protein
MPARSGSPFGDDDGDGNGVSEALAAALRKRANIHGASSSALFIAISDCVTDLRAKGMPRDDVLRAIRATIHSARIAPDALTDTPAVVEPPLERMISRCVADHYGDGGR